jgi:Domain of unknown function (DUF4169)
MSNVVNLNHFRKQKKRAEAEQSADENRSKFGRTKSEKVKEANEAEDASRHLDNHKLEDDEC